jgi:hypothetical protein
LGGAQLSEQRTEMKTEVVFGLLAVSALTIFAPMASAITFSYTAGKTVAPADVRVYPTPGSEFSGVADLNICTGSLISRTVLLTAAHCWRASTATFRLYDDEANSAVSYDRAITNFIAFPGYNISSNFVQRDDIALAFLDAPLPDSIRSYGFASFSSVPLGATATFAGFGLAGVGDAASLFDPGSQLRAGINRIDGVEAGGRVFTTDFDAPNAGGFGRNEVGTAQGDSGSGVFYSEFDALAGACFLDPSLPVCSASVKLLSDEPLLIGVTSYSRASGCPSFAGLQGAAYLEAAACNNRFGTVDGYTFVGRYLDWISSVIGPVSTFQSQLYAESSETYSFDFQTFGFEVPLPPSEPNQISLPSSFSLALLGLFAVCARFRRAC